MRIVSFLRREELPVMMGVRYRSPLDADQHDRLARPAPEGTKPFQRWFAWHMSALEHFISYLADAHACSAVIRDGSPANAGALCFACIADRELETYAEKLAPQIASARLAVLAIAMPEHGCIDGVERTLMAQTCRPAFIGHAPDRSPSAIAVVDRIASSVATETAPADFRVLAVMPAYNEADIIAQTLRDLTRQGIHVHVLDNWSTDDTHDIAATFRDLGVTMERFPSKGPASSYDLTQILHRVEDIAARSSSYDWTMLHDADERRRVPWAHVPLRDALWRVQKSGFNCIDNVTLNFCPIDNTFDPDGPDIEQQMLYFEPSNHPGHFHQRRAWHNPTGPVSLAASAGHDCSFPARRVYPYKFLLKHYPIRSQAHGERKVAYERRARWNSAERTRGWHAQYDGAPSVFLRDPNSLIHFQDRAYFREHLVQRLSGAGYFDTPPEWATSPKW